MGELKDGQGLVHPMGMRAGADFWSLGPPQKDVDKSFRTGIRVAVFDIDAGSTTNSTTTIGAGGNAASPSGGALIPTNNSTSTSGSVATNLSPTLISGILEVLGQPWQYYAIRYLLMRLIPVVSTYNTTAPYTTAINSAVSVGLIHDASSQSATGISGTFSEIAELECSLVTPVTRPAELEYCHTGTDTWQNLAGTTDTDLDVQLALVARFDTTMPVNPTASGKAIVLMHNQTCCVVDYYGLRAVSTQDELSGMCSKLRVLGCSVDFDEKQNVLSVGVPTALRAQLSALPSATSRHHGFTIVEPPSPAAPASVTPGSLLLSRR
jgi:hypothetical protein